MLLGIDDEMEGFTSYRDVELQILGVDMLDGDKTFVLLAGKDGVSAPVALADAPLLSLTLGRSFINALLAMHIVPLLLALSGFTNALYTSHHHFGQKAAPPHRAAHLP